MTTRKLSLAAAAGGLLAVAVFLGFVYRTDEASSGGSSAAPTRAPAAAGQAGSDTTPEGAVPPTADPDTLTQAQQAIVAHRRAERGPEQPIPFNHSFHTTQLQMGCEYCHTGTGRGEVAPMPPVSVCMGCHRTVGSGLAPINRLRSYWQRREPVPWDRVYRLPEFVQFSHQPHVRSAIDCTECHGPVEEMARIYQYTDLSMGWCLECHRQQPQPTDTASTAKLIERNPPPELPGGRQSVGLYPIRIDEQYAETRAPTDCAACHY